MWHCILGCDGGIGRLAALRLDALGCHVFAGCRTDEAVLSLQNMATRRLIPILLDITAQGSIDSAFQVVIDNLPPGAGGWNYSFWKLSFPVCFPPDTLSLPWALHFPGIACEPVNDSQQIHVLMNSLRQMRTWNENLVALSHDIKFNIRFPYIII